jgi:hypothetical protein
MTRMAAALAAIGFASLAISQAALAAGAPWGHAAWAVETRTSQRASEARARSLPSSTSPRR